MMTDALQDLVLTLETKLATVELNFEGKASSYLIWQDRQRAYRGIVNDLVSQEKAKYRIHGGTYELNLAGIRASCTAGEQGLLSAWLRKARVEAEARRVA